MKPIVKWAGGKTRMLKHIIPLIPEEINTYYEPFFGGGAVFLSINNNFDKAVINDLNSDLMNMYGVVKDDCESLISILEKFKLEDSEELFNTLREMDRTDELESKSKVIKAARMIYLNKTGYGGLYRVNSKGEFNVPYAKNINGKEILNENNIREWNNLLNKAKTKILNHDFEIIINKSKKGDFLFVDPPYFDWSKTANFTSYTKEGFGVSEQERLRKSLIEADKRGVKFILTNSGTNEVKEFYKMFKMKKVPIVRTIAASKNKAGYSEYVIKNY